MEMAAKMKTYVGCELIFIVSYVCVCVYERYMARVSQLGTLQKPDT